MLCARPHILTLLSYHSQCPFLTLLAVVERGLRELSTSFRQLWLKSISFLLLHWSLQIKRALSTIEGHSLKVYEN